MPAPRLPQLALVVLTHPSVGGKDNRGRFSLRYKPTSRGTKAPQLPPKRLRQPQQQ